MPTPVEIWVKDSATGQNRILEDDDLGGGSGGGGDASATNQATEITHLSAIATVAGAKTDAKSTSTDATSVSWMQVLKQISASIQAVAAAIADIWDDANNLIRVDGGSPALAAASDAIACDTFRNIALTNTAVAVQAAPSCLYGYHLYNPAAEATFYQFYNVAQGSVTVGTTTPKLTIVLQSGASETLNFLPGISFGTAFTVAATTTAAGGTAPATAALMNLLYK